MGPAVGQGAAASGVVRSGRMTALLVLMGCLGKHVHGNSVPIKDGMVGVVVACFGGGKPPIPTTRHHSMMGT